MGDYQRNKLITLFFAVAQANKPIAKTSAPQILPLKINELSPGKVGRGTLMWFDVSSPKSGLRNMSNSMARPGFSVYLGPNTGVGPLFYLFVFCFFFLGGGCLRKA